MLYLSTNRRRTVMAVSAVLLALMTAAAGCSGSSTSRYSFKDPSGEPIKAVVRTAVPLAYAASVAMSSVAGSPPPNATILLNDCTSIPAGCAAVITIADDDSSVPLQLTSGTGTITVYGYWSSPDQAILTVAFSTEGGSTLFPVQDVSLFPVMKNGSSLTIVYVNIDVNATFKDPGTATPVEINAALAKLDLRASNEASANVDMDAWIIDRNDMGTADLSDDRYSISGGGQYAEAASGSASLLQLGMAGVTMGSGCLLNPDAGLAVLNELKSSTSSVVLATALLTFPATCDGSAKVSGATGNYLLSNGDSIPLNLANP